MAMSPHVCFIWPTDIFRPREEKMSILAPHLIWPRNVCVLHSPLISFSIRSHLSGYNRHDLADVTALRFSASGHWWSICLPLHACMQVCERESQKLFGLCQMHCQLVRVVRERETDPREHFCARAKPVACGVPDSPALYGLALTVFSQHQAGMIKSNRWEWLFQSVSRSAAVWVRYVVLVREDIGLFCGKYSLLNHLQTSCVGK